MLKDPLSSAFIRRMKSSKSLPIWFFLHAFWNCLNLTFSRMIASDNSMLRATVSNASSVEIGGLKARCCELIDGTNWTARVNGRSHAALMVRSLSAYVSSLAKFQRHFMICESAHDHSLSFAL